MMETSDGVAKTGIYRAIQPPALNVGMTLREAREHLGMSVHDVAERIKFAPRQVEALEANDFPHLPQATFLRGFVRSYARMLKLDEAALIAALPAEPAKQEVAKAQVVDVAFPTMKSLRRINVLWLAGALGLALVLGLFVLLHDAESTVKPTETVVESVPLPTPDAAASAVADTDDQIKAPEVIKVTEPKVIAEQKVITEPVKGRKPIVKSAPQIEAASAPVATITSPTSLEVLKRRPLHLVFVESTWAEVIDSHGVVLLSRNNPRGSEKWVGGPRHAPYDISIAHPSGVKLYFRGKEIDLSVYAGMDVAHLRLE
jgi:cytoskeleton protein RodZ